MDVQKPASELARRPRRTAPLTTTEVRALAPGLHGDPAVRALFVRRSPSGGTSFVLRFSLDGRRRDMHLGSLGDGMTLAEARDAARAARALLRQGIDPIEARKASGEARRAERAAGEARLVTFKSAAEDFITTNSAGWSNSKHAAQWSATIAAYAVPKIGSIPVAAITTSDVLAVLQQPVPRKGAPKEEGPLWTERTETATRLRPRTVQGRALGGELRDVQRRRHLQNTTAAGLDHDDTE